MDIQSSETAVENVAGKCISSIAVYTVAPCERGIRVVFLDETELNIHFTQKTELEAEIMLYRWDQGEPRVLKKSAA